MVHGSLGADSDREANRWLSEWRIVFSIFEVGSPVIIHERIILNECPKNHG